MKKRTLFLVSILALLVVLVGLGLLPSLFLTSKDRPTVPVTLSPKWVNQAQFAGVFVARDLGIYTKHGLDVTIAPFKSASNVPDDLLSGRSQFGLMSATEFLAQYASGKDLVAVAAFYQVSPYMVASLKSSGIESPSQFAGKTIGIKGGPGAEATVVFDLLLRSAGLSDADVTYTILPFGPSEREDLEQEVADVVGFYRTRLFQFEKEGLSYNAIYPEQYGAGLYNDVLVVTRDFLEHHPDQVRSFVRATVAGWEYAYDNIDEAVAITLRYVTDDSYKDIDYERYILEKSEPLMRPTGTRFPIGRMVAEDWQLFYDSLQARGFLEESERPLEDAYSLRFF